MDMKIITEPIVKLVSKTQYIPLEECELPPHDNDLENIIAVGGKVSYDSYGKDGRPVDLHVQNLVNEQHLSVLRHVNLGFYIAGVSRGLSHELVRHQAGFSYSQRSTRYTNEDDCAIVLEPEYAGIYCTMESEDDLPIDDGDELVLRQHIDGFRHQLMVYLQHVEHFTRTAPANYSPVKRRKWARGKARQNLPHALETRLIVTANVQAWRHFMLMRSNRGAEAEIRRLAHHIWPFLVDLVPNALVDLKATVYEGFIEVTHGA